METRTIGHTDITVSALGFGGAPLGAVGARIDDETVAAIILAARDGGIRYFDTAPLYGHGLGEKRLGRNLGELPREDFVLSTKVGRLLVPPGQGERNPGMRDAEPVDFRYDYTYDAARASLTASLERLGVDRVDILLCHDIDLWTHGDDQPGVYETAARGALPALADLRAEGTIRAFGLGVNNWEVCARVLADFDPDCFLLAGRFTLLEQAPLETSSCEGQAPRAPRLKALLPECAARGVSVIIGGPYNSGLLAVNERRRATYDYKPVDDARWERAQQIREVCAAHGVDMRAAALQYPLRHPAVASVIPGVWSVEEVRTNLALMAAELPEALWDDLADAGLARRIS